MGKKSECKEHIAFFYWDCQYGEREREGKKRREKQIKNKRNKS